MSDTFIGEYLSTDKKSGKMKIEKAEGRYEIVIELCGFTKIIATGYVRNGAVFYKGEDGFGNAITGTVEQYGEDFPICAYFQGKGIFEEIEFNKIAEPSYKKNLQ